MNDESKLQQYVLLAKGTRGRGLVDLISKVTSEPGLFGFSELLTIPSVQEMAAGEHAQHYRLLELFAFGTWQDYNRAQGELPALNPQQVKKLKQLSVVSLALTQKVIPYSVLQSSLGLVSVRELEDFLISDCFYSGALAGKLDQAAKALQVHECVGRDVRPEQVALLEAGLAAWLSSAQGLLSGIEERMAAAGAAAEAARRKKEEEQKSIEEMRKTVKTELELHANDMVLDDGGGGGQQGYDGMDEDRMAGLLGALGGGEGGSGSQRHSGGSQQHHDRHDRMSSGAARPKRRIR